MDILMVRQKLKALAAELAKYIKTEADLNAPSKELLRLTVEIALQAELTEHLGYERHGDSKPARGNARNGTTAKRLKGQHGEVEIRTPRDNATESLNSVIRSATTHRTLFPNDESAVKVIYLAISQAAKNRTCPSRIGAWPLIAL